MNTIIEFHIVYSHGIMFGIATVDAEYMVRFIPLGEPTTRTPLTNFDVVSSCVSRLVELEDVQTQRIA